MRGIGDRFGGLGLGALALVLGLLLSTQLLGVSYHPFTWTDLSGIYDVLYPVIIGVDRVDGQVILVVDNLDAEDRYFVHSGYTVERSQDLREETWEEVGAFKPAASPDTWMGDNAPSQDRAFYRLRDGMAFVPGGTFLMGDYYAQGALSERPWHSVNVSDFYIDRFEVTNEDMRRVLQFALYYGMIEVAGEEVWNRFGADRFVMSLDDADSDIYFVVGVFRVEDGRENFPVTGVTWYGANAYTCYRSLMEGLKPCYHMRNEYVRPERNGYRLPTEAEWEKAARGGLLNDHYPWPSNGGHYTDHFDRTKANHELSGDPFDPGSSPVGYYNGQQVIAGCPGCAPENMMNGYGTYDMAGNVWEWCWDEFSETWYNDPDATDPDTLGPGGIDASSSERVIRGGGFNVGEETLEAGWFRCCARGWGGPSQLHGAIGFRCVRRGPPPSP